MGADGLHVVADSRRKLCVQDLSRQQRRGVPEHFSARLYWFCVCDRVADLETQPSEGLALNSWVLCSDAFDRRPPCECDLAVWKETQLLVKASCNLRRTLDVSSFSLAL